jgi:ABC-2 type transport system permease protein
MERKTGMRLYLYQLKNLLRSGDIMFWTMAFPIVLGTLFYVSFGNASMDTAFSNLPVGVVVSDTAKEGEYNSSIFYQVIKSVSNEGKREDIGLENASENVDGTDGEEDALFTVYDVSRTEGEQALDEDTLVALILVESDMQVEMEVGTSSVSDSISASIVEAFLNQYLAQMNQMERILKEQPESATVLIQNLVMQSLETSVDGDSGWSGLYIKDDTFGQSDYNPFINYFYALIGMTCLFGSMFSQKSVAELQADQSALGARRNVAPTKKSVLLMVDIMADMTIQFAEIIVALLYLIVILKIDFGDDIGCILLVALVGSFVGNSIGIAVGTFVKGDIEFKVSVISGVTMVFCFFSGLMYGQMYEVVEEHAPWFNRINPAALIVNAFHSLVIYDTRTVFYQCLLTLLAIGLLLDIVSIIILRRTRYASI